MRTRALMTLALAAALVATMATPAFAKDHKATGLDRAMEASVQAIDHAKGRAVEARGGELPPGLAKKQEEGKLTGRDRAAASIAKGLERGNGNGNAFGRGHAAEVLGLLLDGQSPATLEGAQNHGAKVSAMVHAHNELRKAARAEG